MFIPGTFPRHCTCGVGQGSGPGGNLFCACINLIIAVFIFSKVLVYVDDAQAYIHSPPDRINHAVQQINADSQALHD